MTWWTAVVEFLRELEATLENKEYQTPIQYVPLPPNPPIMTVQDTILATAKASIGKHMTLDNSVPISVGCAEAVSAVLKLAGIPNIPPKGIAGTAELLRFLEDSSHWSEITQYENGAVIVSATGTGNGKIRGHTGICGVYGILSNESQTGLWKEQWDMPSWKAYYQVYGGIPTHFFRFNG